MDAALDMDRALIVERRNGLLCHICRHGIFSLALVCGFQYFYTVTPVYPFHSFVVIKVIMGVNLVSYATRRRAGMEAREAADVVNDFGRAPIGEGKEEQV